MMSLDIGTCIDFFNVALYVRLSEEDQRKKDSRSVENQKNLLIDYIADKPNLILYSIYEDVQQSGADFERPEFKRLMDDIKKGAVNCIIVKDLSRFGRNYIAAGQYIEQVFPLLGVRFIAINDDFDSYNYDDNEALSVAFKNVLNEVNLKEVSARIVSTYRIHQQAGDYMGSIPPYGYFRSQEDPHKLVIDPVAAQVVKQIFEWKFNKWGETKIAMELNRQGCLPPRRYFYEAGILKSSRYATMTTWYKSAIVRILNNPVYTGDMYQHRYEVTKISSKRNKDVSPEQWIVVPNTHEAIISKKDFQKMQDLLQQIKAEYKQQLGKYDDLGQKPNLLKGIIFCGNCGRPLMRHRITHGGHGKELYYVYQCSTYERISPEQCSKKHIREEIILGALYQAIRVQVQLAGIIEKKSKELEELNKKQKQFNAGEITVAKRDLSKLKSIKQRLYEEYAEGRIGRSEYAERKKDIEANISAQENKLRELQEAPSEYQSLDEKDKQWMAFLLTFKRKRSFTAEHIHALVKEIHIHDSNQIDIVFNYTFQFGLEGGGVNAD